MKSNLFDWFSKAPTLTAVLVGIGGIFCAILVCCFLLVLSPLIGFLAGIAGVGVVICGTGIVIMDIYKTRKLMKKAKNKDLLLD